MDTVRITRTPRGAHQLHFHGFSYFKRDQRNDKTYWRCASPRCSATAITGQNHSGKTRILKEGEHSHSPALHEDDAMSVDSSLSESEDEQSHLSETTEESHDSSDGSSDEEMEEAEADEQEWEEWEEEESEYGDEEEADEEEEEEEEVEEEEEDNSNWLEKLIAKQRQHRHSLRLLRDPDSFVREAVLKNANKDLICFLNEICLNILNGYFSLSKYELNIFKIFNLYVRALANIEVSWINKKDFLVQHYDEPFIAVLLNILAANQNFGA